jgi:hypothetical protein
MRADPITFGTKKTAEMTAWKKQGSLSAETQPVRVAASATHAAVGPASDAERAGIDGQDLNDARDTAEQGRLEAGEAERFDDDRVLVGEG